MKILTILAVSVLLSGGLLVGCAESPPDEKDMTRSEERSDEQDRTPGEELDEALSSLGNALEELGESLNERSSVEPVDYRDLRDLLPGRIRGLEKGNYNGERTGTLGIKISKVEQEYESDDGDESVDISIIDLGSLRNVAAFGVDWLKVERDRESNDGFERTTQIDDHPALEKCQTSSQYEKCEIHLLVGERFVVDVVARGLSIRDVRNIVDDIDLRGLEKMRNEGVSGS